MQRKAASTSYIRKVTDMDQRRIELTTKAWPLLMGAMLLMDIIKGLGV